MNFKRITTEQYSKISGSRVGTLLTNLKTLEKHFGKAHYHNDVDFPDDDCKCSICIGLQSQKTNKPIQIWSYKMWHYNDEAIDHDELVDFSVYFEDENDFKELQDILNS